MSLEQEVQLGSVVRYRVEDCVAMNHVQSPIVVSVWKECICRTADLSLETSWAYARCLATACAWVLRCCRFALQLLTVRLKRVTREVQVAAETECSGQRPDVKCVIQMCCYKFEALVGSWRSGDDNANAQCRSTDASNVPLADGIRTVTDEKRCSCSNSRVFCDGPASLTPL
jgi:hypothetical protein